MTFENILQLAVLTCICVGVTGLILPSIVFLPSRRAAVAVLLLMFVPLGAAIEYYPPSGEEPATGATIGFAICWIIIAGGMVGVRSLRRKAASAVTSPSKGGVWDSIKRNWVANQKAERVRRAAKHADDLDRTAFLQRVQDRQDEIARNRQAAEIRVKRAAAAPVKPMGLSNPLPRGSGDDVLRFEYVDVDGVITVRSIRNWTDDGVYLRGWCEDRRTVRTFRMDRVIEWY